MTNSPIPLSQSTRSFWQDEDGAITILALSFLLITLVIGGLSVDFNRVMADRTRLQIAADTAAHAALYSRDDKSADEARQVASDIILDLLPTSGFGSDVITSADVSFGVWNPEKFEFTAAQDSKSAVRLYAAMAEVRNNASRNLLLHILGFDTFDVGVQSVFSTYYPPCLTEGFVADNVVDIQSNNRFSAPFCVHANNYVSLNQNNVFEAGTGVSMPDISKLDMPNSGYEKNSGLEAALRQGVYRMRLLADLPEIIDSFWTAKAKHLPPYVAPGSLYEVDERKLAVEPAKSGSGGPPAKSGGGGLTPNHFMPGVVNYLACGGSGKITLGQGTYSEFVFITSCEVKFASGTILEDVVIATTNTAPASLSAPSNLNLGRDDACAAGGGAVLMTLGGFRAAAKLNVFGGQILALGDIKFAANANGIQGASFISGGNIDGTSNMRFGSCNQAGMEHVYRAQYFKMVQ